MYERLISFMDFEGAAISIIDEEQMDAVKELCNTMLDKVYIPYLEHVKKYFPQVQMICLHDDWGSQRAPFFSIATAREMFVPIMKRFAEKCKNWALCSSCTPAARTSWCSPPIWRAASRCGTACT